MWPVMRAINSGFELLFRPFQALHPLVGLTVVSVVTGVVMLLIFGKTSNQAAITATKDKLKAHIMEMWLFRIDPRVMFCAIGNVFRYNAHYLRHSLRPIIFIIIPVLIIMIQLGLRYGHKPLAPGNVVLVSAHVAEGMRPSEMELDLAVSDGLSIVSPPLRIDSTGEVDWKVRVDRLGTHGVTVIVAGERVTKRLVAESGMPRIAPAKAHAGSGDFIFFPAEPPIPKGSALRSIEIAYPAESLDILGLSVHWLLFFFIVSVAAGFALKGVFGVEV